MQVIFMLCMKVLPIFPQLVALPSEDFKAALDRILQVFHDQYMKPALFFSLNCKYLIFFLTIMQGSVHTGPALTPAEVLIAIHGIDPERDHIPLPMVVLSTITDLKFFISSPEKPIIKAVAFTHWLPLWSHFVHWSNVSVFICNKFGWEPQSFFIIFFKCKGLQRPWTLFLSNIPFLKLLVNFHLQSIPLFRKNFILLTLTLTLYFIIFNNFLLLMLMISDSSAKCGF